jgi:hypothetical protein
MSHYQTGGWSCDKPQLPLASVACCGYSLNAAINIVRIRHDLVTCRAISEHAIYVRMLF